MQTTTHKGVKVSPVMNVVGTTESLNDGFHDILVLGLTHELKGSVDAFLCLLVNRRETLSNLFRCKL